MFVFHNGSFGAGAFNVEQSKEPRVSKPTTQQSALTGVLRRTSDELQAFVLHLSDLGFWQEDASVQRERQDVGGDRPRNLLRFEGQDKLVVGVGDELEGGEAVGGAERASAAHHHALKLGGAAEH